MSFDTLGINNTLNITSIKLMSDAKKKSTILDY